MKVQPINNNAPSFGKLNITAEAKALIEKERGGKTRIKRYTKELANSKWDLKIKTLGKDKIFPIFGEDRECCVIPCHLKDEFMMVYSSDAHSCDNEDDINDCLKFSSAERAQEVFETLKTHFHNSKTQLQMLDWHVYAMKAFTEAEIVPQTESPWAHFLKRDTKPAPAKQEAIVQMPTAEKKLPFSKRLKEAWKVLLGK